MFAVGTRVTRLTRELTTHDPDGPMAYTEFRLDGTSVAGLMAMPPMVPAEVPTYWNVYFAVADCDATS